MMMGSLLLVFAKALHCWLSPHLHKQNFVGPVKFKHLSQSLKVNRLSPVKVELLHGPRSVFIAIVEDILGTSAPNLRQNIVRL